MRFLGIIKRICNCIGSLWIVIGLVGLSVYCVIQWMEEKRRCMMGTDSGSMAMAMAVMGDSMIGFVMMVLAVTIALGFMYDWRAVVLYVYFSFLAVLFSIVRGVGKKKDEYNGVLKGSKKFDDVFVRVK